MGNSLWEERVERKASLVPLTFGFDIGIASVGWAVLNPTRIVALGIRAFDAAEEPKTGASLNEHRRIVRTQRNRLHRRTQRLKKLRRLLRDAGVIPSADIEHFTAVPQARGAPDTTSPWALRARGLDNLLEPGEWARVLYHIVKHRGFHAARKSETIDEMKEGGKLSKGVKRTANLKQEGRWRTIGEMAAHDEAFAAAKRNKAGSYENSFSRKLLDEELRQLFAQQRAFGNPASTQGIEDALLNPKTGLLWYQKEALTGEAMLKMVGNCTFEKSEPRAPKRSFSAERFIWLSLLNRVRVDQGGERRPLTPAERDAAKPLPYELQKVSYKQLRDRLVKQCGFPKSWREASFSELSYRPSIKRDRTGNVTGTKEPEEVEAKEGNLIKLPGWHDLKKELDAEPTRATWQRLAGAALSGNPSQMDAIALALSIYKSDEELRPKFADSGLDATAIEAVLKVDYTNFIHLSTKAIAKLMPHLETGERYDAACKAAGYDHANPEDTEGNAKYLPPFSPKEIRNPVVFRSLNQASKVLNALIREHGSPCAIHVELARDLSKSFEERKDIERGQREFQVEKQATVDYFIEQIGRPPRGDELLKMRLYREQDGQCAYSLKPLAPEGDIRRIFETGQTQVDHILPYSRSFDDSQNNKILVLTRENQNKGNRTPFEYLGGAIESPPWREFEAWVRGHKMFRKAKRDRLLRKNFGDEEAEGFRERNLNDTRYVTRLFAGSIRQHLKFAPDESGQVKPKQTRVLCPAGGFTSFMRARWGLVKNREQSDLHHAQDACVIAAASLTLQKRVGDYSRTREEFAEAKDGKLVHLKTGEIIDELRFPRPWPLFHEEIKARLSENPRAAIEGRFDTYDEQAVEALAPVLVSRAVKRRSGGAAHEDTVRSVATHLGPNTSSKRVRLEALKLSDIDDIVGAGDARNAGLIAAIRERLAAHKGDGKKAFGPGTEPLHKPRRDGTPGPIIRAVKVKSVQKGGVPVRGGVADQASMWRVDVFHKANKYYLVPIYQADRRKGTDLPSRAVLAYKQRNEWTPLDDSFDFKFSLYPNDYIFLKVRDADYAGYFAGLDVSTAAITVNAHDRNIGVGKDGQWRGLGVKLGVQHFEKFHVDVLGNRFPVRQEIRRGLA